MSRVLCFGSLNIDYTYKVPHFAVKGETVASEGLNLFTGGKGLNQSVALAQAGVEVIHAGSIGRDGEFLADFLASKNIDTSLIERRRDVRTGNAIIQNDSNGENSIILYGGTNRCITREYVNSVLSGFLAGDYILLQNEISEVPYIIEQAHGKGLKVVLNPSPVDANMLGINYEYIDMLILNTIEAMQLCGFEIKPVTTEREAKELIIAVATMFGNAQVLLTFGENGSMYYDGSEMIYQEAYSTKVVDTTAAGDTFTGFFLGGIISGLSVKDALDRASRAAAISVSRAGAAPSIPGFAEVEMARFSMKKVEGLSQKKEATAVSVEERAELLKSCAKPKTKIIMDCDTGSDDAVALMMAMLSDDIELLGICTVAGNKNLDYTTENTLAVVEALGRDIPVYRGCAEPLVAKLLPNRHGDYNGMTGVNANNTDENGEVISYHTDHLPLPKTTRTAEKKHAVNFIIDTLMKSHGDITVVTTGPMTNLAMAIRMCPEICTKIKEIVFMGGGYKVTNATSAAEFNIWNDPEACQIVISAGVRTIMVPLDATHQAYFTEKDCDEIEAIGSIPAKAVAEMSRMRIKAYDLYQPQAVPHIAPIHDALALSYCIEPHVLRDVRLMRVDVDISGGYADGQTICDSRALPDRKPNVYVALGADTRRFVDLAKDLLKKTAEKF